MGQQVVIFQNGKRSTDVSLQALRQGLQTQDALLWLDIEGDPVESVKLLTETFKLSRLMIEALCEPLERAKFIEGPSTDEGARIFSLVTHGLAYDEKIDEADTPKLDIAFGANFIITAHQTPFDWLTKLQQSCRVGDGHENIMGRGMPFLLHAILDALVDSYFPVLDTIDDVIDDLENVTVNDTSNAVQARIFRIKRSLALMRRVISPQVEVANSLAMRTGALIPAEAEPYFADVRDHLVRAFEILDAYRDLMSGLLDVHLSTVSNRLNTVMKQLAIIATIFMPITFVTGVFGQNFGHMPQVENDAGYNFWLVLGFMALITIVQLWYFHRRGWL
ncbi:MAG: magnesium/cobalt transporter CorA [Ktedonobacterales bacterium]